MQTACSTSIVPSGAIEIVSLSMLSEVECSWLEELSIEIGM